MQQLGLENPPQSPLRHRTWKFWLFVLSPFLLMGACTVFGLRAKKLESQAMTAATTFHTMKEAEQYSEVYNASSVRMKRTVTAVQLDTYLQNIRRRLGLCQVPQEPVNWLANANDSGTTVRLVFHVQCSQGALDEIATFVSEDGAMKLLAYEASSPFALGKSSEQF